MRIPTEIKFEDSIRDINDAKTLNELDYTVSDYIKLLMDYFGIRYSKDYELDVYKRDEDLCAWGEFHLNKNMFITVSYEDGRGRIVVRNWDDFDFGGIGFGFHEPEKALYCSKNYEKYKMYEHAAFDINQTKLENFCSDSGFF